MSHHPSVLARVGITSFASSPAAEMRLRTSWAWPAERKMPRARGGGAILEEEGYLGGAGTPGSGVDAWGGFVQEVKSYGVFAVVAGIDRRAQRGAI